MKIALIFSKDKTIRSSYQSGTRNLKALYELCFANSQISSFYQKEDIDFTALELERLSPDKIIFIDQQNHPFHLLNALKNSSGLKIFPQITIHLFGDFALNSEMWLALSDLILGNKVLFLCASEKHKEFISQFIHHPEKRVKISPFPVDSEIFNFDKNLRDYWRGQLKLAESETAVVYSGRLSYQKNIHLLIQEISQVKIFKEGKLKLFLIGHFDDEGSPYFGINLQEGHYYHLCSLILKKIPEDLRKNIYFLGNLKQTTINGIFNGCDIFCSLSLKHDEIFGLSPVEAMFTGLPTVLSHWGGYTAIKKELAPCFLVDIVTGEKGHEIKREDFKKKLEKAISYIREHNLEDRNLIQEKYKKEFSFKSVAEKLKKIHEDDLYEFKGFTNRMELLNNSMYRLQRGVFAFEKYAFKSEKCPIYLDLYHSFFNNSYVKLSKKEVFQQELKQTRGNLQLNVLIKGLLILNQLPFSIRYFPYLMMALFVKILFYEKGFKLWVRNSIALKYFTFGLSDIDFTFYFKNSIDDRFYARLIDKVDHYINLKNIFPVLGEINIYLNDDLEKVIHCGNYYELQRDPLLLNQLKMNWEDSLKCFDKIVFVIRMLDSDYHNLKKFFALRKFKWNFHLKKLLDSKSENLIYSNFNQLLDFLELNIFQEMHPLQWKKFLLFYFENKKNLGDIYENTKYRLEFMTLFPQNWAGYAIESGNIDHELQLLKNLGEFHCRIMIRQIDWEIWGGNSQYLLGRPYDSLQKHFKNIKTVLEAMNSQGFSQIEPSLKSFEHLEHKFHQWIRYNKNTKNSVVDESLIAEADEKINEHYL